jgi:hypothetical protein
MQRDKRIERDVVEPGSAATLQDRLKKMTLNRGGASTGASRKRSTEAMGRRWKMW